MQVGCEAWKSVGRRIPLGGFHFRSWSRRSFHRAMRQWQNFGKRKTNYKHIGFCEHACNGVTERGNEGKYYAHESAREAKNVETVEMSKSRRPCWIWMLNASRLV